MKTLTHSDQKHLNSILDEYKKVNPSSSFWVWCVNTGHTLDFSEDVIEVIKNKDLKI